MPIRRKSSDHPIAVKFTDPTTGQSISFTVYGYPLKPFARDGHAYFSGRYRTTDINDRRHKRRF